MAYEPTGRTRNVEATGEFTGTSDIQWTPQFGPPKWAHNFLQIDIQFLGTWIRLLTRGDLPHGTYPPSAIRYLDLLAYTGPGLGQGASDTDENQHDFDIAIPASLHWLETLNGGTFSITAEMEEVEDVNVHGVSDPSGFPSYGGAVVHDPPRESNLLVAERLVLNSTLTVTATVAGMSVSASVVVDAARQAASVTNEFRLNLTLDAYGFGKAVSGIGVRELFINLGGNNAILTGSIQASDADHALIADTESGKASVDAGAAGHRTILTAVFAPMKEIDFGLSLRAMEHAYPSSARFRVDKKLTDLASLTTMSDGSTLAIQQEFYTLGGSFQSDFVSDADFANVATPFRPWTTVSSASNNKNEFCSVRLWLDASWIIESGEQPNDWRTLLRGRPFHSFDLTQAAEMVVSSTLASGTGAGDLTIALPTGTTAAGLQGTAFSGASLRGYRYLRLRMKASTNETVTVSIGSKTWDADKNGASLALTTSYADFDLDLCSPTNQTASVDDTETFFPLPTVDGEYWGVSSAASIVIGSIGAGVTVDVEEIKVVRDSYSKGTFLQPFPVQWIPAGDSSEYPVRFLDGDTDGKRSLEGIHCYRPSGGGTLSIRDLSDLIGSINGAGGAYPSDGWAATPETVFPDAFHDNSLPACFARGAGALYQGTAWAYGFDLDATGTLSVYAQSLWDSLEIPPLWGDGFFYVDGGYSGQGMVRAAKILRSQIVGLVFNNDSLPAAGILVSVNNGADGSGTTLANGSYQTGLPYPKGGPIVNVSADAGPPPVPSGACVAVARRRERMCFRVEPGTAEFRALEMDSVRAWLHVGVGNRIRTYHAMTRSVAFESEEYANVDTWKHLCVDSRYASLLCLGVDGSTYRVYVSEDGGLTGTETLSVTANSSALKVFSEVGLSVFFFEDGAGVFRQESEDNGATWSGAEAVTYNDAPLDATLLDKTGDPRASDILRLSVEIAGDTMILMSEDYGKTFTLELS